MKQVEMQQATHPLAEYTRDLHDEPLVVTVDGKPVAALLPIGNADIETVSLSTNPDFLALIERSRSRQTSEGGLSTEDLRRRLMEPHASKPPA